MEELIYFKTKNGWTVRDIHGRSANGITKEHARNVYFLKYEKDNIKSNNGYDMSQFNNKYKI